MDVVVNGGDRHEQQEDRTDLLAGPSRPEVDPARDFHVDEEELRQDPAYVDLRHHDPGHFVFELNRISDDEFRCRDLEFVLIARLPEAIPQRFAQHCISFQQGPFFFPGGVIAPGLAQSLTPPNSSPEAPGAAP